MANWYYRNRNNEKVGPISVAALRALTQQGLITRETIIENHSGRTAVAGEINGLVFPDQAESVTPPEPVTVDDIEPPSVSPEPDEAIAMQFGSVPIHTVEAPAQSEVYGLSAPKPEPKPAPPVEQNPFSVAPPVAPAKKVSSVVEETNPFTSPPPKESNPFAGITLTESRKTPQSEPLSEPVAVSNSVMGLSKPVIFGGIIAVIFGGILLFLLVNGTVSRITISFTDEEQDEIDEYLLEHGNDKRSLNDSLIWMSSKNKLGVVKYLISEGANVNAKMKDSDFTPLHAATLDYRFEIMKYLISKGANINAKDTISGSTPLHLAVENGHFEAVEYLILKKAGVNAKNKRGITPLYRAIQSGNNEIAKLLVSKGANVNAKTNNGRVILHQAALQGNVEGTEFLISAGADVNVKDKNASTPLHEAARFDGVEVGVSDRIIGVPRVHAQVSGKIAQLRDFDLDSLNMKNASGQVPSTGSQKSIDALRQSNTQHNVAIEPAPVPATISAKVAQDALPPYTYDKVDVAKLLVKNGADIHAKNKDGLTPFDLARKENNREVAEYLSGLK